MRAVVFFVVAYYFSLPAALTRVIPRHSTMKEEEEEENGPQTKKSVALFGLSANPVTDRGGHDANCKTCASFDIFITTVYCG